MQRIFVKPSISPVKKSVQELRAGKGTAHELIEVEDEWKNLVGWSLGWNPAQERYDGSAVCRMKTACIQLYPNILKHKKRQKRWISNVFAIFQTVARGGLEPSTPRVWTACSSQLSYLAISALHRCSLFSIWKKQIPVNTILRKIKIFFLENLKGRFSCRSRWHLPLTTDFSVVRQPIGTRSPIRKLVFPLPANCPAPEVRKESRILCVSPQDRHIAHPLTILYTAAKKNAILEHTNVVDNSLLPVYYTK